MILVLTSLSRQRWVHATGVEFAIQDKGGIMILVMNSLYKTKVGS